MNPKVVFAVFLALGAIWTGVLVWVFRRRPPLPYAELGPKIQRLRKRLLYPLVATALVVYLVSLAWVAYPSQRVKDLGPPQLSLDVSAAQWAWSLSQDEVPAGTVVEFRVTAQDVNHSFAIYSPEGRLLAQVQAMPRYTNRLVVRLDRPGAYIVRCLEYCGIAHHGMSTAFRVK